MIDLTKISSKIKKFRLELGWSQKKLANKVKVSQATICRAEISCANIKLISIIKIFKVLKKQNILQNIDQNIFLREEELDIFINVLKKNDRVWALIHYDPYRTVKIFIEMIEKNFRLQKKIKKDKIK